MLSRSAASTVLTQLLSNSLNKPGRIFIQLSIQQLSVYKFNKNCTAETNARPLIAPQTSSVGSPNPTIAYAFPPRYANHQYQKLITRVILRPSWNTARTTRASRARITSRIYIFIYYVPAHARARVAHEKYRVTGARMSRERWEYYNECIIMDSVDYSGERAVDKDAGYRITLGMGFHTPAPLPPLRGRVPETGSAVLAPRLKCAPGCRGI